MAVLQRKNRAGEARYVVRVRDPIGKWFPSATFDRKADAERFERDLLLKRARAELPDRKWPGR